MDDFPTRSARITFNDSYRRASIYGEGGTLVQYFAMGYGNNGFSWNFTRIQRQDED